MNDTTTPEQEKEERASPREVKRSSSLEDDKDEYPSEQQDKSPSCKPTCRDDGDLQQSVEGAHVKPSPRVSFTQDQLSEWSRSFRQHQHSSSSSLSPPPSPAAEGPIYQLDDTMRSPQGNSQSRGYGSSDVPVPSHRLMSKQPRNYSSALGQLSAAASYKMTTYAPDSPVRSERKRRFQVDDDETDDDDMGWGRKKPKMKGQGKQAERWDAMFDRLVQFHREHGHCLVPNRYPEDPSLGAWVSTQRRHYKILMSGATDQTTPMTEERASRLASIGFAWETSDPRHVPWEIRFEQLLEYKEKYGKLS